MILKPMFNRHLLTLLEENFQRAADKYPEADFLSYAFVEEMGEFAQQALMLQRSHPEASAERLGEELLDVLVIAMRMLARYNIVPIRVAEAAFHNCPKTQSLLFLNASHVTNDCFRGHHDLATSLVLFIGSAISAVIYGVELDPLK